MTGLQRQPPGWGAVHKLPAVGRSLFGDLEHL